MSAGTRVANIGEVPQGWELMNLSDIFHVIDGDRGVNYPKSDEFLSIGYCVFLNAKNVTKSGFRFDEVQFITKEKDELLGKGKLKRGDLVLTTRGTLGNFAFYNYTISYNNLRINSGMVILRPSTKISNIYYFHYFNSYTMQNQIERFSFGTAQPQLTVGGIQKFKILVPPLPEQQKIASILSTVDSAIEKTDEIIQETKKLKKGLMQKLFTEGIGHTRFKETKIGRIPEEWEVVYLKDILSKEKYSIVDGPFGSNLKTVHYRETGIPIMQSGYVTSGKFSAGKYYYVDEEKFNEQKRSAVKGGDILMAKIGVNAGACASIRALLVIEHCHIYQAN